MKIAHLHVWDKKNKGDQSIVLAVQQLLKKHLAGVEIIDLPLEVLRDGKTKDFKRINQADLVVIGGGGIYYRWFLPFDPKKISQIKPPIVIFGVGYIREIGSPPLTKKEIESIAFLNQKAVLSSVRDYYTKKFLLKAGVRPKKIQVIGDPAIFLTETKPPKINLSNRPKIGLNLNYSGWLGFGRYEKDIIRSYNETGNYFQKKYGAEIYYLQHHPDEKKIRPKLLIPHLHLINYSVEQQKYIYGKMDLVIGMMLHSAVLAFGAGTPEINVAYDLRNRSFANFIGCPDLVISSKNLKGQALLNKAKLIFKNRQKYRQKFKSRKEKIWQKQQKFLNQMKKYD
ncbi:MAG: polysaccharide pyruvyl transferase family protein [Patescibacteria group bacterium]|jgi:polysaccharide pyruvyl transferase WcaK-like protein